jgi:sulfite reductase beta subunit-like hemoprotein
MIDAPGLRAVAAAATRGNGIVELTSRAGLQVRGLPAGSAEEVARILGSGGLLPSVAHDRVRNILAPPLGGRAPGALADTDTVVAALDRALCREPALVALPGRFMFAVDDGTRALAAVLADVELVAEADGFRLRLAETETTFLAPPDEAAAVAIAAAREFVALLTVEAPGLWRVRDLPGGGRRLSARLGLGVEGRPADRPRAAGAAAAGRRPGIICQRNGHAAVSALPPLARLDPGQLRALAALLAPDATVRLSPWRTLTVVDVPMVEARGVAETLSRVGLVLAGGSGWEGLSACAGLGACARARADVRAAAALRAPQRADASPREHWSGCERRCGEPADAGVTVVATADGLLVRRGDGPPRTVSTTAAAAELISTA